MKKKQTLKGYNYNGVPKYYDGERTVSLVRLSHGQITRADEFGVSKKPPLRNRCNSWYLIAKSE